MKLLSLLLAFAVKTITVFSPQADEGTYNHNVVLFPFKGELYAQWQNSSRDEDAPDTRILYSHSADGAHWSAPEVLCAPAEDGGFIASGGWWTHKGKLIAFINRTSADGSRSCLYISSKDGKKWSKPRPVRGSDGRPMKGIIEQDLHALPSGRILTAFHMGKGMICTPFFTDDPSGVRGWKAGYMPHNPYPDQGTSREIEPSWYLRADNTIVMLFRDQASSFRKMAAESRDNGKTWTLPALTDIPDSRSKQCAGNLPDGRPFIVWNPSGSKDRWPLALSVSTDGGYSFPDPVLLRTPESLPPMRHEGRYKRPGFSYPKAVVWNGCLWVGYATNKEDVEISFVEINWRIASTLRRFAHIKKEVTDSDLFRVGTIGFEPMTSSM